MTAKQWLSTDDELDFFEAIQRNFYFNSEDLTKVVFYKSICEQFNIPYEEFKTEFESKELKQTTHNEFALNRSWGVRAYPTILLSKDNEKHTISRGYDTFDNLTGKIEVLIGE